MADPLIENPTWKTPIKSFFNDIDISHMLEISERSGLDPPINLASYNSVLHWKDEIWQRISTKSMPIPPSQPWSDQLIEIYRTWKVNGYPKS